MQKEFYSRDEAIAILDELRIGGCSVPTFYRWVDKCYIGAKDEYSHAELETLKGLAFFLNGKGKVKSYQNRLIKEMKRAESRNCGEAATIDITATYCD